MKLNKKNEISEEEMFEYFAEDFDDSHDFYGLLSDELKQEVSKLPDNVYPSEYIRDNYPNIYRTILHKWISELFIEQNFAYVEDNKNGKTEYHYFEI